MQARHKSVEVGPLAESEMANVSDDVRAFVKETGIQNGVVTVFAQGSTAAVTVIEFEPGLQKDFPRFLERWAPKGERYFHEDTWHDGNGHSHIRASLLKPDLTVPIVNGEVATETWQQIVVVNLDARKRKRKVLLTVLGE